MGLIIVRAASAKKAKKRWTNREEFDIMVVDFGFVQKCQESWSIRRGVRLAVIWGF